MKAIAQSQEGLNRLSEWGGVKIPGLIVEAPRGLVPTTLVRKWNQRRPRKIVR